MVPGEGIEPTWCCHRRILSPLRLPVPPSRLVAARLRVHYNGAAMNLSIDDFEYDLPSRLIARLLSEREALAQIHAGRPAKPGSILRLSGGLNVRVLGRVGEFYHLRFPDGASVLELLERHGSVPLPPYITHSPDAADESRYQ